MKIYIYFLHNLKNCKLNLLAFLTQKPNWVIKIVKKTTRVEFKKNQAKVKKVIRDF